MPWRSRGHEQKPTPDIGALVEVRGRPWLVEGVADDPPGLRTLQLSCVSDGAQGEPASVLWDAEVGARLLDADPWSRIARDGTDDAAVFAAYLRTLKWKTATAANRDLFRAPAAPPTMVLQRQDALEPKFGLTFQITDRERIAALRRSHGFGVNPWATGSRFLISHRLLTDETCVAGLRDMLGEFRPRALLVLDVAHHVAPAGGSRYAIDSRRRRRRWRWWWWW